MTRRPGADVEVNAISGACVRGSFFRAKMAVRRKKEQTLKYGT